MANRLYPTMNLEKWNMGALTMREEDDYKIIGERNTKDKVTRQFIIRRRGKPIKITKDNLLLVLAMDENNIPESDGQGYNTTLWCETVMYINVPFGSDIREYQADAVHVYLSTDLKNLIVRLGFWHTF